jgi:hypothetical protein
VPTVLPGAFGLKTNTVSSAGQGSVAVPMGCRSSPSRDKAQNLSLTISQQGHYQLLAYAELGLDRFMT